MARTGFAVAGVNFTDLTVENWPGIGFKHAVETGELILAGRTQASGAKTFGIAVFDAPDEAAAWAFRESDPAVVAGSMTAELHPFAVALQRKNP
jgi:uncharacterized protein